MMTGFLLVGWGQNIHSLSNVTSNQEEQTEDLDYRESISLCSPLDKK